MHKIDWLNFLIHQKFYTRRSFILRFLAISIVLIVLAWGWIKLAETGFYYEWQWNRAWRHFGYWTANGFKAGPLLKGIMLTCGIAAFGMLFSLLFGLLAAVLRLSPWLCCQWASRFYINLWRNTPLLLQLFFIYFLISPIFSVGPFWTAVFALSAFEGAYMAEIFRGGLLSVSKTQWEAALSLGFNLRQSLFLVILPQALKNTLPAFTNQLVSLIKDTSLVSAIAVADLTMRAQAIVAETFLAFEIWLLVGGIYLTLALLVALPGIWLEKKRQWH